MALTDLTDRASVLKAIDEFDRHGRDAFLSKYGFGKATGYFVEHAGNLYDSKALAGAAHGYQHGSPLKHTEFSGGEATVAARLEALNFVVTRPGGTGWRTAIGTVTTRAEMQREYGGTAFGGIEPSRTSPNILVYTDPEQGSLSGYNYDGWDLNDSNVFYYTGEGRKGDQQLRDGNRAIVDHAEAGRTLRLFEAIDKKQRPGGKRQRYLGAFRLDDAAPYRFEPAPDAAGVPRQVIVFRLIREDAVPRDVPAAPPAPATAPAILAAEPTAPSTALGPQPTSSAQAGAAQDPPSTPDIELIPSEQVNVSEYEISPRVGALAKRDEGKLVGHFETWLRNKGHDVQRVRIKIPGERHPLLTDPFDLTTRTLYEAKSGCDRATIRLGIGQILDYLRFIPDAKGALLLPTQPSADLQALISSCGLGLVYKNLGSWVSVR